MLATGAYADASSSKATANERRLVLTIGMSSGKPCIPFELINNAGALPFALTPFITLRSESFPWLTPIPTSLCQTPDIVDVLIGYKSNELYALADQGLIEPLDSVFQELALDPQSLFQPNVYKAVCYRGHVWAIPHRVQTYLFSLDIATFEALGIEKDLQTWSAVLHAGTRISSAAVPGLKIPGFTEGDVPVDLGAAILLDFVERCHTWRDSLSLLSFFSQLADDVLPGAPGFSRKAIRLETFSTLQPQENVLVVPAPSTSAIRNNVNDAGTLGFLECFALRRNTQLRYSAAKAFVKWLVDPSNQWEMLQASRLDLPSQQLTMGRCYIPTLRQVLNSEAFRKLSQELPAYQAMADASGKVAFCSPEEAQDHEDELNAHHDLFAYVIESKDIQEVLTRFGDIIAALQQSAQPELSAADSSCRDPFSIY